MAAKRSRAKEHVTTHKDGSVWARGRTIHDVPSVYWKWLRKDGTRMRSGHFGKWQASGRVDDLRPERSGPQGDHDEIQDHVSAGRSHDDERQRAMDLKRTRLPPPDCEDYLVGLEVPGRSTDQAPETCVYPGAMRRAGGRGRC